MPLSPDDVLALSAAALGPVKQLIAKATSQVRTLVSKDGAVSGELIDREQAAAHGLSWYATYGAALQELHDWAQRLKEEGQYTPTESLILQIGFGEYLAQLIGGVPMSQLEIIRPADLGLASDDISAFLTDAVKTLIEQGNTLQARADLAARVALGGAVPDFGNYGLDETHVMVRDTFAKFAETKVAPFAHAWHSQDELIPLSVIQEMADLGVFGLTIPENLGGHGLGKVAMCVVSEELSRAYIGVGSLGTRSEIAAELIMTGGTDDQKAYWLPKIASGEVLPTAVFTEPNTGSDLASLRTRAVREGDHWSVTGNKTWITHAARADVMTLLVRTDPTAPGYKGLSMFLAEKPRGTDQNPFPAAGMTGGEIGVLGYRGMKEYEIGFDGFKVPHTNLLGQKEGQGFKQLMATFESARIQTAARAVGVAQSALDLGLKYARERIQFGKPIYDFPRVSSKIAIMVTEVMIARQMTFFAAREKDAGRRCDLEAGMAKLLGARVAWAAADNALQIHGGNGFALEYPISRVLCDARILNIFEGAAEIQAQVIARRLLDA